MKQVLAKTAAILGVILFASSSANAAGPGPITSLTAGNSAGFEIVKVHSQRAVHHMLHDYGYDRVRFQSRRTSYNGTPVYSYRACKRHRAYHIKVNYYGQIIHKHRAGWCGRHNHHRKYNNHYKNDYRNNGFRY